MAGIASVFSGGGAAGLLGLAGSLLGGLFGGKQETPAAAPAPTVPKPAVMPIADDEAVKAAKKRSLVEQMQRKGRQSTILTDGTDAADVLGG
jgi:hypothetical protein